MMTNHQSNEAVTTAEQVFISVDLAGVVVGETAISHVDGQKGQLSYRGVPVEQLVKQPFWQVVWLLISGDKPSTEQEHQLAGFMANQEPHTTLRLLSGLMTPTGGSATLAGFDVATQPQEVKRVLGFLTANTGLYQRLSAREILIYFAQLHGITLVDAKRRATELIDWLGIGEFAELRSGAMSTGQKQRVNIARALIADPPILIMDEPTQPRSCLRV